VGAGVSETGHAPLNLISTFILLSHSELFEESLETLLNNKRPSCMFGFYLRNRRGNQEWTIQRKQKGQSRMDNPEKRKLEMFPKIETKHTRRPLVI
jgi:hypothetical protein